MRNKPRVLVVSHVLPVPRETGQQQRVYYTLRALREVCHVTFLTVWRGEMPANFREAIESLCDELVVLPSRRSSRLSHAWHGGVARIYAAAKSLKTSNYIIGQLEFSPSRIAGFMADRDFDCVLFEYWHSFRAASVFRQRGIPSVMDLHNLLWRSYAFQIGTSGWLPGFLKRRFVERYRKQEEASWSAFDSLVTINAQEFEYVKDRRTSPEQTVFYAPMGIELNRWPYGWEPAKPARLGFYGGLASEQNQVSAMFCAREIMPLVWRTTPEAEFWIVGSNPPESIRSLAADTRIRVTGYVDDPRPLLGSMTAVLCPWTGTFGFRSRVVELLAMGVPLLVSADAIAGMDLTSGRGLHVCGNAADFASTAIRFLDQEQFAREQSELARRQVDPLYSYDNTYGKLACDIAEWLKARRPINQEAGCVLA